jgi:hypothetical protein
VAGGGFLRLVRNLCTGAIPDIYAAAMMMMTTPMPGRRQDLLQLPPKQVLRLLKLPSLLSADVLPQGLRFFVQSYGTYLWLWQLPAI